jgi:peptidyl-prolyl cis-trans isomerase D
VLKQLQNGEQTSRNLARKYSEDPGSANGGRIASAGSARGRRWAPTSKRPLSTLYPRAQISGLVKSSSTAFHIIRVDDRQDAHMKTLDEVKDQIEPILKQQKAQQVAQKQTEDLLQQAKKQGLDAAAAAKACRS